MAEYWPLIAVIAALCLPAIVGAVWEWRRDRRALRERQDWSWEDEERG